METILDITKKVAALTCSIFIIFGATLGLAAPQGEQVVNGSVTFDHSTPAVTNITASDGAIINYQSFDIYQNETVQFFQPDANSSVLNRVIGSGDPSIIFGSLMANGQVYLVNPAGITFGENAFVDVGALYAAAGQISDQDFLAGLNKFSSLTGSIENYGGIYADSFVALIGSNVLNAGDIVVPDGMVSLVAGDAVYLGQEGSNIFVNISAPIEDQTPGVENTGVIDAGDTGHVFLGAGDIYSVAIRNSGIIDAQDITLDAGTTGIISVEGNGALDDSLLSLINDTGNIDFQGTVSGSGSLTFTDIESLTGGNVGTVSTLSVIASSFNNIDRLSVISSPAEAIETIVPISDFLGDDYVNLDFIDLESDEELKNLGIFVPEDTEAEWLQRLTGPAIYLQEFTGTNMTTAE